MTVAINKLQTNTELLQARDLLFDFHKLVQLDIAGKCMLKDAQEVADTQVEIAARSSLRMLFAQAWGNFDQPTLESINSVLERLSSKVNTQHPELVNDFTQLQTSIQSIFAS